MADLSFRNRWFHYIPNILGNREDRAPFRVQVRRLSRGELDRFAELANEVRRAAGDELCLDPDRVADLFDGVIRGPFGRLTIDGVAIEEGNLRPLIELACQEFPFPGCIFDELVSAVVVANDLSEEAEKNFARRRGGPGTTPPAADAGSHRPADAPTADASSTAASTSSASTPPANPD